MGGALSSTRLPVPPGVMEDAELPRRTMAFADEKDQTDGSISKIRDDTTLRDEGNKADFTLEDQLPDHGDFGGGDFLEEGFGGFGDGEMMDMGAMPGISDINLEEDKEEAVANGNKGISSIMCYLMQPVANLLNTQVVYYWPPLSLGSAQCTSLCVFLYTCACTCVCMRVLYSPVLVYRARPHSID